MVCLDEGWQAGALAGINLASACGGVTRVRKKLPVVRKNPVRNFDRCIRCRFFTPECRLKRSERNFELPRFGLRGRNFLDEKTGPQECSERPSRAVPREKPLQLVGQGRNDGEKRKFHEEKPHALCYSPTGKLRQERSNR